MISLTLLCEANLEVETLRREAFKRTTPRLYKSLITKLGESKTLLFGDSMEEQMKSLETKEKFQKALEQIKAPFKKTWSTSTSKKHNPYGKAAASQSKTRKVSSVHRFRETGLLHNGKEVVLLRMVLPLISTQYPGVFGPNPSVILLLPNGRQSLVN